LTADNRSILITGTSKGIGKYLCEYYLDKNYTVYGCSRSKASVKNKNYFHFTLDITDEKNVVNMFIQIRKQSNGLDVLINNAGIASMNHFLLTPLKTIQNILNTNTAGAFLISREAAKLMKKKSFARIINLSSIAAVINLEGEAVYASSKAALNTFTKILAKELAHLNITVNCIGLTPVKTDLIKSVPDDKIKALISKLTIKRLAEFKDISNVTDFLIKKESSSITGQLINLGGI